MRSLSVSRKIEGYEVLAKLFECLEHQEPEKWKPSTYCQAKAIGLRYGIEIEEIEILYSFKSQPSKPPPAKAISVKVSEVNPIKVSAELETLICGSCQTQFEPKTTRQKFCSNNCSSRERNRKHRNK
jgi:hypothetical protein